MFQFSLYFSIQFSFFPLSLKFVLFSFFFYEVFILYTHDSLSFIFFPFLISSHYLYLIVLYFPLSSIIHPINYTFFYLIFFFFSRLHALIIPFLISPLFQLSFVFIYILLSPPIITFQSVLQFFFFVLTSLPSPSILLFSFLLSFLFIGFPLLSIPLLTSSIHCFLSVSFTLLSRTYFYTQSLPFSPFSPS